MTEMGTFTVHETTEPPAQDDPPFLDVRDLRVHFPTDDGLVKSVDGLSFAGRARQDLGHRGGVGLRQERDQPGGDGPAQGRHRQDQRARSWLDGDDLVGASPEDVRRLRGKRMAMIFQDPLSAMHPYYTVGNQIIEAYRIHNDVSKNEAREHAIDMLGPGRHPRAGPARRRVPAPVLRRDAAAGDDRDGAVVRPRAADRRRADDRARRHRPGADPRPDPRSAGGVQLRGHLHHPRPRSGGRAGRRHPGDVRRAGRRVRHRRAHLQRAGAPLHVGSAGLDAALRPGQVRTAGADPGLAAEPDQRPAGLRLPPALRLRRAQRRPQRDRAARAAPSPTPAIWSPATCRSRSAGRSGATRSSRSSEENDDCHRPERRPEHRWCPRR